MKKTLNKKILIPIIIAFVLVVILLAAFLFKGLRNRDYKKFPEGYKVSSVDVGGMTVEEAKEALKKQAETYKINMLLDEVSFDLTAKDLGLEYSDNVNVQEMCNFANGANSKFGKTNDKMKVNVFNMKSVEPLKEAMLAAYELAKEEAEVSEVAATTEADEQSAAEGTTEEYVLENPTKASITYNQETGSFIGVDGVSGDAPNYDNAVNILTEAVKKFEPTVEAHSELMYAEGEIAANSAAVSDALNSANAFLNLKIDCVFAPEGKDPATETIDAGTIASWLAVQKDGLTVDINAEVMSAACSELAQKHDVTKYRTAKFKTTTSGDINISVATSGQTVDANQFYNDIYELLTNKQSGTVNASYSEVPDSSQSEYVNFDGNYCEVDLTNQMVYVYKGGNQVVSSPVVTGCVAKGYGTPTGVYSIFSMDKDRYLNGPGYKTWVNFFLPFNGGIGFHDAGWRSTFGGSIYLYNGSHGCINMPYSAVKTLYENVSMGTKVVVYGGVSKVEGLEQTWSGTSSYTVEEGSGAFQLDANCLDNAQKTYQTSNPAVATVDATGIVTPVGVGSCSITINAASTGKYKAASTSVSITVNAKPQPQQPQQQPPQPQQPQQPESKKDATITAGDMSFAISNGIMTSKVTAAVDSGTALKYYSNAPTVVTVDENTGIVTVVGEGTATITIKSEASDRYNSAEKTITVTVTP